MGPKFRIPVKKKRQNPLLKNEKWTVHDKVEGYTEILKLQKRHKKRKDTVEAKLREKENKKLIALQDEVQVLRELLRKVQYGDRTRLHRILVHHEDLLLAHGDRDPDTVYRAVIEDCDSKRKQYDELIYLKSIKTKEFSEIQMEWTDLTVEYEKKFIPEEPDVSKEKLIDHCKRIMENKKAAESLRQSYLFIINGLEKDKQYFDEVFEVLGHERKEQRQLIMKVRQTNQSVAHELQEKQKTSEKMKDTIWEGIKARRRALKVLREHIRNVSSHVRLLVRVESRMKSLPKPIEKPRTIDKKLEEEVQSLEETLEQVKGALLTQSTDDFLTRFEEQARQKTRLLELLKKGLEKRDWLLNKKNHAILILNNLEDFIPCSGDYDEYKKKKNEMLHKLEIERNKEVDFINLRNSRGTLIVNIKAALQNMLDLMVCITPDMDKKEKTPGTGETEDKESERSETKISKSQLEKKAASSSIGIFELEKFDANAINLIARVTEKATILFRISNFDLSPQEKEDAKNLYESYIADYKSRALHKREDSEFEVFVVEHEIVDTSVLTREDIKLLSKEIVDAWTKTD